MMTSEIAILPLNSIENVKNLVQLCYISESNPHNGKWCKIVMKDDSYAICRMVRHKGVCGTTHFMDHSVGSPDFGNEKRFSHCVTLKPTQKVENVSCIVTVTNKFLLRPRIVAEDLQDVVQILLRGLMLVAGSCVSHSELDSIGIDSIQITKVHPNVAENECFELSAETSLKIKDIRLKMPFDLRRIDDFQLVGFEAPMQALEDLLCNSRKKQVQGLPTNALLVGPVGSGKSALLGEFLHRHQVNSFHISASSVFKGDPGQAENILRANFSAAYKFQADYQPKSPIAIILEDLELLCPSSGYAAKGADSMRIASQLYQLIDDLPHRGKGILCLATSSCPDAIDTPARRAGRFGHEISIEVPSEEQRRSLFDALWHNGQPCPGTMTPALLDYVAQHTQGAVIGDLRLLLRKIISTLIKRKEERMTSDVASIVHMAVDSFQPSSSRSTDVRVGRAVEGFEIIGGMETLKRSLEVSILAALRNDAKYAEFGLSLPRGVLLYGPPGCGKTTIAKCLAKEANMTFIWTSAAEIYSPYVGCAERFIVKIFDAARKNAPCLIFLDEIDALVGRRTVGGGAGGGGGANVQLRILSTLLTEMDGIVSVGRTRGGGGSVSNAVKGHILVVGATNRPDMIDDALLRPGRFDKLIHVPPPDLKSRLSQLRLHARHVAIRGEELLDEVAELTENYSGADLSGLWVETLSNMLAEDIDCCVVDRRHFKAALDKSKSSLSQKQIESYNIFGANHL